MQTSILNLSEVKDNNENFRFDAEYFKNEYLLAEKFIEKHKWFFLEEISSSIINFGAYSLCNYIKFIDNGVPYLNVGDIGDNVIDYDNTKKIDKQVSKEILKKSLLQNNQVLLTIAGTIGNSAVAYDFPSYSNSNQAIANITLIQESPFFISTYLNCKYGKLQTQKLTISSVQPNLLLTQVKKIKIPIFSTKFQSEIERVVTTGHKYIKQSKELYNKANDMLEIELGLKGFQPTNQKYSIVNLNETKKNDFRIDAEFYQPKYDEIIKKITSYHGGYKILNEIVTQKKNNFKANENNFYKYVEIGSINVSTGDISCDTIVGSELPANAKIKLSKNDFLVSTVRTYRGAITFVTEDDLIGSGAFTVFNINEHINKETLFVLLRTKTFLDLTLKYNIGTSYPTISNEHVLSLPIPMIDNKIQTLIAEKIQKTFSLRHKAKALLELAKTAVETAIEHDEQTATDYINEELAKLNITL